MYDVVIVGGGPAGLTRPSIRTGALKNAGAGSRHDRVIAARTDQIDNYPGFPLGEWSDLMDSFCNSRAF
jgi:thioredoxin reductase